MSSINIRPLRLSDESKVVNLLKQLTSAEHNTIAFAHYIQSLTRFHCHFVIERNGSVVGTATLLLESKIIHNFSVVGHIEDVVIDRSVRGLGLGKKLIKYILLYAKEQGAYKVILDCQAEHGLVQFYSTCGLVKTNIQMSKYF